MAQRDRIGTEMQDPDWPGDAKVAGWWLWGQCCWIGSGWCDWFGQIPHAGNAGMGVQAIGQIPHASDAGRGADALLTSCGRTAWAWLHRIANRLERVRVVHGDWSRCLNNHFGGDDTAVFLDPPYRSYEALYGKAGAVADAVETWARDNGHLRIALCERGADEEGGQPKARDERSERTDGESHTVSCYKGLSGKRSATKPENARLRRREPESDEKLMSCGQDGLYWSMSLITNMSQITNKTTLKNTFAPLRARCDGVTGQSSNERVIADGEIELAISHR